MKSNTIDDECNPSLKPCPFCGSEEFVITEEFGGRRVNCRLCFASARLGIDKEDAADAWNTRFQANG